MLECKINVQWKIFEEKCVTHTICWIRDWLVCFQFQNNYVQRWISSFHFKQTKVKWAIINHAIRPVFRGTVLFLRPRPAFFEKNLYLSCILISIIFYRQFSVFIHFQQLVIHKNTNENIHMTFLLQFDINISFYCLSLFNCPFRCVLCLWLNYYCSLS